MVDGEGDPNTAEWYAEAIEALYALAYTLKFNPKKGPLALDYSVMPLEGLWSADDLADFASDKSRLDVDGDDHAADLDHGRAGRGRVGQRRAEEGPVAVPAVRQSFDEG